MACFSGLFCKFCFFHFHSTYALTRSGFHPPLHTITSTTPSRLQNCFYNHAVTPLPVSSPYVFTFHTSPSHQQFLHTRRRTILRLSTPHSILHIELHTTSVFTHTPSHHQPSQHSQFLKSSKNHIQHKTPPLLKFSFFSVNVCERKCDSVNVL